MDDADTDDEGVVKVQLIGCVPIPTGHRVEVTWYEESRTSLRGRVVTEPLPFPLVVDLNTGVRFGSHRLFSASRSFQPDAINVPSHAVRDDLSATNTVRGMLLTCSIVTISNDQVETELRIEPAARS